jgi:hypothetical protein
MAILLHRHSRPRHTGAAHRGRIRRRHVHHPAAITRPLDTIHPHTPGNPNNNVVSFSKSVAAPVCCIATVRIKRSRTLNAQTRRTETRNLDCPAKIEEPVRRAEIDAGQRSDVTASLHYRLRVVLAKPQDVGVREPSPLPKITGDNVPVPQDCSPACWPVRASGCSSLVRGTSGPGSTFAAAGPGAASRATAPRFRLVRSGSASTSAALHGEVRRRTGRPDARSHVEERPP